MQFRRPAVGLGAGSEARAQRRDAARSLAVVSPRVLSSSGGEPPSALVRGRSRVRPRLRGVLDRVASAEAARLVSDGPSLAASFRLTAGRRSLGGLRSLD